MSVLLNNAVEGAVESYQKQLEVKHIKLDLETPSCHPKTLVKKKGKSEDLFELDFQPKEDIEDLDPNNVKEILRKICDNVIFRNRN